VEGGRIKEEIFECGLLHGQKARGGEKKGITYHGEKAIRRKLALSDLSRGIS